MLEMRPNCEACDTDLDASAKGAFICSFECTWCQTCAEGSLSLACPNCGGALAPRPPRSQALLKDYPASTKRVGPKGQT